MIKKILSFFCLDAPPTQQPISDLVMVLEQLGGGVHKRVDENRELLELLQKKAPTLLEECPWVEGWLRCNDEVFTALGSLAAPLGANNPKFSKRPGFPRPWPEQAHRQ